MFRAIKKSCMGITVYFIMGEKTCKVEKRNTEHAVTERRQIEALNSHSNLVPPPRSSSGVHTLNHTFQSFISISRELLRLQVCSDPTWDPGGNYLRKYDQG